MKESELDASLKSFHSASLERCGECMDGEEKAKHAREHAEHRTHGAANHIREAIYAEHDRQIAEHTRGITTHARRAAWAEKGLLLVGPDERADADFALRHRDLHAAARAAARVRYVDVYDDGDDDSDPEEGGEDES